MRKAIVVAAVLAVASSAFAADRVRTANGTVEGVTRPSGIHAYLGIPFAAPPVGDLRWKPPQPVKNWTGTRSAAQFGPRCVQASIFSDMNFRSNGMSEDCLYLNVWTPAKSGSERLPVLVYFYGGGFVAGDGSEPRYDGESMARKDIVSLTVNYRLGVFGFLAHPDLTKESPHHASGNYALFDQRAALQWVQKNIAAFGGDPKKVTIAGESAGSIAVSAQMASPLSKALIAGAIGESGALIAPTLPPVPLAQGEEEGTKFAASVGAASLAALRAISTGQIQDAAAKLPIGRFASTVDGYFLPKLPVEIFAAGEQARVPLLVGWNTEESSAPAILASNDPTPENLAKALQTLYGDRANDALKVYAGSTPDQVWQAATDLASDRFIAYSTWKWADLHAKTSEKPVYRYLYAHPRPPTNVVSGGASSGAGAAPRAARPRGAVHSAEIEYAMGNLATNKVFAWTPDDYRISDVMQAFFANFVKTGNPNGPGVPQWPASNSGPLIQFMRLDLDSRAEPDKTRERYLFLDTLYVKPPKQEAQLPPPPVVDMHLHAEAADAQGPPPLAVCTPLSDLVRDAKEDWAAVFLAVQKKPLCSDPVWSPATDAGLMKETLDVLKRRNIIGVVSGSPDRVRRWRDADPDRVIPALGFQLGPKSPSPDEVKRLHEQGQFVVFGEVTNQYVGVSPSDQAFEPYLAVAEQRDIPVGIHIGTGPPGAPYLGFDRYRASLHSPLLLEEALLRHPKLRVYIMHAGWPMLDDLLAVLWAHPQVYVEVGAIDWALPRAEIHRYLQRIVEAGFGKRVMFGSDQMVWPGVIERALQTIEAAHFLTEEQKRDILYNNAARFLRFSDARIARHQGR